jgi:hypothetical protein
MSAGQSVRIQKEFRELQQQMKQDKRNEAKQDGG